MHVVEYCSLSQLHIHKIVAVTNISDGQKFLIKVYFNNGTDNVCRVNIDPVMTDHRTGEWITYSMLDLANGVSFAYPLRDKVRNHATEVSKDIISILFGVC